MTGPGIHDPHVAVSRAMKWAQHGQYILGTGDKNYAGGPSDCAGYAICYTWGLSRHQPGFNHGPWATVSDDVNTDSMIEDAEHNQELFEFPQGMPMRGDLLVYKTIVIGENRFIGHVSIITNVPNGWVPGSGNYHRLDVIQCRGPNGKVPGVICSDGSVWDHHDAVWGHGPDGTFFPERVSKIVRVKGQTVKP